MRPSLFAALLALALAACANDNHVTVTIAAVTGTEAFHCVGVPTDGSGASPCGGASVSVTRYDPLQITASASGGGADGQVLVIEAPSMTDNASACLKHTSGGISPPSTIECADSGTLTLSAWPMTGTLSSGTTHLHFPDGATIDATFTTL